MDSSATPDKDDGIIRINRMEPGHVDIVLGSHPGKHLPRPLKEPRAYGLIILCALLAILSLCLLVSQYHRHAAEIVPVRPLDTPVSTTAPPSSNAPSTSASLPESTEK